MKHDLNKDAVRQRTIYKSSASMGYFSEDELLREDFVEHVLDLLPAGGRSFEVNCGSGWHSLALTKTGIFDATLRGLAESDVAQVRENFERAELSAKFIVGDEFEGGASSYDLVFHNGSFEGHSFDEQVASVKAMATKSRRYVLSIAPNSQCYWYWIWRIVAASQGQWSYGAEVPVDGHGDVFSAAGLKNIRVAYLGVKWTENIIAAIPDLSSELRDAILLAHRSAVIPTSSKAYLVATVGEVMDCQLEPIESKRWSSSGRVELEKHQLIAALADAMSNLVGSQSQVFQLHDTISILHAERSQAISDLDGKARIVENFKNQLKGVSHRMTQLALKGVDLQKSIAKCELEINCLNQTAIESNTQIASLNHILVERDTEIDRLNQAEIEHTKQVASLSHSLIERDALVASYEQRVSSLDAQLAKMRASIPWRLTKLLYVIGLCSLTRPIRNLLRRVLRKYREVGALGLFRIVLFRALSHMRMSPYAYKFDEFVRSWRKDNPIDWRRVDVPFEPGLVSIILPSYNGEEMVAEALDSLVAQTYKKIEIIAINDGSSDSTGEILKEYAARDSRIKVYNQKNQKLPKTLSRGFRMARGEFLTWTSIDNRLKSNCIELMVSSLERNSSWDMVYSNIDIIGEDGKALLDSEWYAGYQSPPGSEHVHLPTDVSELNVWPNNYVGAAFLYRARVAWSIGDYSASRFLTEDYDYWMRVNELMSLRHADFNDCIYDYRFHGKSLTSKDKELGITKNRVKLMVFDDFRRSFYLSKSVWVITSDGSVGGKNLDFKMREELKRRQSVMVEAEALDGLALPRMWMPVIHVHCADASKPTKKLMRLHDTACSVYLSSQPGEASWSDGWDMVITTAPVASADLPRIDDGFRGWWSVQSIADVATLCNIQAKNKQLTEIELITVGLESCVDNEFVSVVVCTYRRSATLENCLRSLAEQTLSADRYEIVLVNNEPSDQSPHAIAEKIKNELEAHKLPKITIVDCPLPGLSYARNAGLSASRGGCVVFVDDDAIANSDCLQHLAAAFISNPEAAIIGGHIRLNTPAPRPDVCPPGREALWSQYLTGHQKFSEIENWWDFPYGALWAGSRKALFEMGGFRCNFGRVGNDFGGGEEIVAALVARSLGYRVGVEPQAEVLHDVELHRYSNEHVEKTIKAGLIVNYKMQAALYLPRETTLPLIFRECILAIRNRMMAKLKIIIGKKINSTEALYAIAYSKGRTIVLREKTIDFFRRFARPQVCK